MRGCRIHSRAFTGEDVRFTTKGDSLYVIALAWPEKQLKVKALGTSAGLYPQKIQAVTLLGCKERLQWTQDENALTVTVPQTKPCDHAFAFRIVLSGSN